MHSLNNSIAALKNQSLLLKQVSLGKKKKKIYSS